MRQIPTYVKHESKDDWPTRQALYDRLNRKYRFTCDVCASKKNAKHKNHITKKQNALVKKWRGVCFMNPPYSETYVFVRKAFLESLSDRATVICLLPSKTDSAWWHEFVWNNETHSCYPGVEIEEFIRGRETFEGAAHGAPFASVIVTFWRKSKWQTKNTQGNRSRKRGRS